MTHPTHPSEPAEPTEPNEGSPPGSPFTDSPFTPEEAAAIDRAVLQDKQRGGRGQRDAERALREQIQRDHRNKESWT